MPESVEAKQGMQVDDVLVNLKKLMPWTRMFASLRLALDVQKVVLAAVALFLIAIGDELIRATVNHEFVPTWPWQLPLASLLLQPLVVLASIVLPFVNPGSTANAITTAGLRLCLFMLIWSIFAGAVTRMAASQIARDQSVSAWAALKFSCGRLRDYLTVPFLAVIGIGFLWLLCALTGFGGRIPWIGEYALAIFWCVPLLFGLLMAVILLGFVTGWPLSVVTIGVQGTDGFEGFSRPLNYVLSRPGRYLLHWLLAVMQSGVVTALILLLAILGWRMAVSGVAAGSHQETAEQLFSFDAGDLQLVPGRFPDQSGRGKQIVGFWHCVFVTLVKSFPVAYFWCAATMNYFLLRKQEDAVEFEEFYMPANSHSDNDSELALAGMAASETPGEERPVRPPDELTQSESSD